jgi:hypothetical protein
MKYLKRYEAIDFDQDFDLDPNLNANGPFRLIKDW